MICFPGAAWKKQEKSDNSGDQIVPWKYPYDFVFSELWLE